MTVQTPILQRAVAKLAWTGDPIDMERFIPHRVRSHATSPSPNGAC
jgi:hypothetical protein